MNKFRIFTGFIVFSFLLSFFASDTLAATKTSGNLEATFDEPIFSSSDAWYPGFSLSRDLVVKNKGGDEETVIIASQNETETGSVASVFYFKVSLGQEEIYGGGGNQKTLSDFWDEGEIELSKISAGESKTYKLSVEMDSAAGNQYQAKEAIFDLLVGFLGKPSEAVTFVGVGGAAPGPPVCSASAPTSAPALSLTATGAGTVSLTWTSVSPATHYLIAYGLSSGNYLYGNPNVGNVTSYEVSGLSGGTTYFLVVEGVNDCAPGPFSNEVSATPSGPIVIGPAPGFIPGVLGVEEEEGEIGRAIATIEGEVKGVKRGLLSFRVGVGIGLATLGVVGIYLWLKMKSR